MKFEKFLSAITPIGIFGSALVGMIMLIVGGETGVPELMIAGGIVIGVGIGVIAVLNIIFKRISPSLETRLGLDRYDKADTEVESDDDDGEVPNARYEAILGTRLTMRTVSDIFDREDALTELMERSEMNGLMQHYEEEADKLWDVYEGEESSDAVDKLYELIDKYYGMYRQALPYFIKSKENPSPATQQSAQSEKSPAPQPERTMEHEQEEPAVESKVEPEVEPYVPPVKESPIAPTETPEPIAPAQPTQPAARTGAAVGYKPMKKK